MYNYEQMARKIYAPVMEQYGLQFAPNDDQQFFLIGKGFALWIFVLPREARSDLWYVSADQNGSILTYTLMYRMKETFTSEDSAYFGDPKTYESSIAAYMRAHTAWLLNRCPDLLSGDKAWLMGYEGKAHYSRHVARFLAPYFREQGYNIVLREE
jgi:hypothetical protein